MEEYQNIIAMISLTFGVGWASGINLYATMLVLGLMNQTGYIVLPEQLQILSHPMVLFASGAMYMVEFFIDKIPGVDSAWDTLHYFIRIPFGALLAYGATGDQQTALELAAVIVGGGTAALSQTAKSGTRILVNTSPEPFSNWFLSVSEDVAVIIGLWAALKNPILFLVLFVCFIIFLIWLMPKIFRGIKSLLKGIMGIFIKPKSTEKDDDFEKTNSKKA